MGKVLVIAEKPSVGRDIAKVLGCSGKGDGFVSSEKYIVSWAIGHLVTLSDPEDYDPNLKRWKRETLPIMPNQVKLKAISKTKKQLDVLKKLMNSKDVDELICATDSGREGELIFRYIYEYVKCKKPFKRLWISSMTDTAIENGFKNLKDGIEYDNLFYSAKCRSEADWLVGINATRAYTLKYNALLSIGRVQTPTLAILVDRQIEINNFKPVDYWEVKATIESDKKECYSAVWWDEKNKDTKIYDQEKALEIERKIKEQQGYIKSLEIEEKKQPPPLLYDLTELQRDCNRKFGFSAKTTLSVAQDLYEKRKLITYPRTDSRYLSDDIVKSFDSILQTLAFGNYIKYTDYILNLEKLPVTKRIVDNKKISDHHAIIPTEKRPKIEALSDMEAKVYDLIARRFMSVFYPPYIYSITKIITAVPDASSAFGSEPEEKFITKGNTIIQLGFMELNIYPNQKEKQEEVLPLVKENDIVLVKDSITIKKKTEPPKPYTEATLLSAMENAGKFVEDEEIKERLKESGIGTPATRASIIERLLDVGYVIRKGKSVIPTDKGIKIIQVVPHQLKSAETTGKWEKGLLSISKGNMDSSRFMQSIGRYVYFLIGESGKADADVVFEDDRANRSVNRANNNKNYKTFGNCPCCENGKILENSKAYYCDRWKNGCHITIWKNKLTGPLTDDILKTYSKKS